MSTVKRKGMRSTEERRAQIKNLQELAEAQKASLSPTQIAAITARFDGYSERNCLLIASQRPTATDVSGYGAWLMRGRRVRKGEKGIAIIAPMPRQRTDEDGEVVEERLRFRLAWVFDIAQTEPIEKTEPSPDSRTRLISLEEGTRVATPGSAGGRDQSREARSDAHTLPEIENHR